MAGSDIKRAGACVVLAAMAVLVHGSAVPLALAADGDGTIAVAPSTVSSASTGNTLTFDYVAAGAVTGGTVTIDVPPGWSAPSMSASDPGYVTSSLGTVSLVTRTIVVSNVTMSAGDHLMVVYGDKTGSGPGATAASVTGAQEWHTQEADTAGGTLTDTAAQPSVTLVPDGAGTIAVSPPYLLPGVFGTTTTLTYTAGAGGVTDGSLVIYIPGQWPDAISLGATISATIDGVPQTLSPTGGAITLAHLTLAGGHTLVITYHDGDETFATADVWRSYEKSTAGGTLTALAGNPIIDVVGADGQCATVDPVTKYAMAGQTGVTVTLQGTTFSGGAYDGTMTVLVPAGWAPPSTDPFAAGYTTTDLPSAAVSTQGQLITISGTTFMNSSFDITYGDRSGGGPGAAAPKVPGHVQWIVKEQCAPTGKLTGVGNQEEIVVPADGAPTVKDAILELGVLHPGPALPGDHVAIDGTGLASITGVSFGGVPATEFESGSDISAEAVVPDGAVDGKVIVTTLGGSATAPGVFRMLKQPAITAFSPAGGGPGTAVTINGTGFLGATEVDIGGHAAAISSVSDTRIVARITPGSVGTAPIHVANRGYETTSSVQFFGPPGINSSTPASGKPGDTVEIDGWNLEGVTAVSFGGVTTAPASVASDGTSLDVLVPPNAKSGTLSVKSSGGSAASPDVFSAILPPAVTGIAPTVAAPGATITLSGSNLSGVDDPLHGSISFGGAMADADTIHVLSATKLTVVLPPHSPGSVAVTVTNAAGGATSKQNLTIVAAPSIDSVAPLAGPVGTKVTIHGENLAHASGVVFSGGPHDLGQITKPLSTTSASVSVRVPVGAVTGPVSVVNFGASSSPSSDTFAVSYVAPSITSTAPSPIAPGGTLTIIGKNLSAIEDPAGGASVDGMTVATSDIDVLSDTKITIIVPFDLYHVAPLPTTLMISNGTDSVSAPVTLAELPDIIGFGLGGGVVRVGQVLNVFGTGLQPTSLVTFTGGKGAKPFLTSYYEVSVRVPNGAESGPVTLTVAGYQDTSDPSITVNS
jgi:hypothetical protein